MIQSFLLHDPERIIDIFDSISTFSNIPTKILDSGMDIVFYDFSDYYLIIIQSRFHSDMLYLTNKKDEAYSIVKEQLFYEFTDNGWIKEIFDEEVWSFLIEFDILDDVKYIHSLFKESETLSFEEIQIKYNESHKSIDYQGIGATDYDTAGYFADLCWVLSEQGYFEMLDDEENRPGPIFKQLKPFSEQT